MGATLLGALVLALGALHASAAPVLPRNSHQPAAVAPKSRRVFSWTDYEYDALSQYKQPWYFQGRSTPCPLGDANCVLQQLRTCPWDGYVCSCPTVPLRQSVNQLVASFVDTAGTLHSTAHLPPGAFCESQKPFANERISVGGYCEIQPQARACYNTVPTYRRECQGYALPYCAFGSENTSLVTHGHPTFTRSSNGQTECSLEPGYLEPLVYTPKTCPVLAAVPNGVWTFGHVTGYGSSAAGFDSTGACGSTATLTCNTCYTLSSDSGLVTRRRRRHSPVPNPQLTCDGNSWSHTPPTCNPLGGSCMNSALPALPTTFHSSCTDTAGWWNGVNPYHTCQHYETMNWCVGGARAAAGGNQFGAAYNYPENNCCVCGKPSGTYGVISGTGTTCGSTRSLSCKQCFRFTGFDSYQCQPDATWTNGMLPYGQYNPLFNHTWTNGTMWTYEPACVLNICPNPPQVPNSNGWSWTHNTYPIDNIAPFESLGIDYTAACGTEIWTYCDYCHKSTGDLRRQCIAESYPAYFNGTQPTCTLKTCPLLPAVTNGRWEYAHDQSGNYGVGPPGSPQDVPSCGSVATLVCDDCFSPHTGNVTRTCNGDSWDGIQPTCEPIVDWCPALAPAVNYDSHPVTPAHSWRWSETLYGQSVPNTRGDCGLTRTYECDTNRCYRRTGIDHTTTCHVSTRWDPIDTTCSLIPCPYPNVPVHAHPFTFTHTAPFLYPSNTEVAQVHGNGDGTDPQAYQSLRNVCGSVSTTTCKTHYGVSSELAATRIFDPHTTGWVISENMECSGTALDQVDGYEFIRLDYAKLFCATRASCWGVYEPQGNTWVPTTASPTKPRYRLCSLPSVWRTSYAHSRIYSQPKVTCHITAEHEVTGLFVAGRQLQFSGDAADWTSTKIINFPDVDATLAISVTGDFQHSSRRHAPWNPHPEYHNGCSTSGLTVYCTSTNTSSPWHQFRTNPSQWQASGSNTKSHIPTGWTSGQGGSAPCVSSSVYTMSGYSHVKDDKIWANNGAKYAWLSARPYATAHINMTNTTNFLDVPYVDVTGGIIPYPVTYHKAVQGRSTCSPIVTCQFTVDELVVAKTEHPFFGTNYIYLNGEPLEYTGNNRHDSVKSVSFEDQDATIVVAAKAPQPYCTTGIQNPAISTGICCSNLCAQCGGTNCALDPAGAASCCGQNIINSQVYCSNPTQMNCLMPTDGFANGCTGDARLAGAGGAEFSMYCTSTNTSSPWHGFKTDTSRWKAIGSNDTNAAPTFWGAHPLVGSAVTASTPCQSTGRAVQMSGGVAGDKIWAANGAKFAWFSARPFQAANMVSKNGTTYHSVSDHDCLGAAHTLHPTEDLSMVTGWWNSTPYGCAVRDHNGVKQVYYNTNTGGQNDGTYSMICGTGAAVDMKTRTCDTSSEWDGGWTGKAPACLPNLCPTLVGVPNGIWTFDHTSDAYSGPGGQVSGLGTVATLTCDMCYHVVSGTSVRTCMGTTWTGSQPSCARIDNWCPNPATIVGNAKVDGTGLKCGDTRTYSCDAKCYNQTGSVHESTCSTAGVWTPINHECVLFTCPAIAKIPGSVGWTWTHDSVNTTESTYPAITYTNPAGMTSSSSSSSSTTIERTPQAISGPRGVVVDGELDLSGFTSTCFVCNSGCTVAKPSELRLGNCTTNSWQLVIPGYVAEIHVYTMAANGTQFTGGRDQSDWMTVSVGEFFKTFYNVDNQTQSYDWMRVGFENPVITVATNSSNSVDSLHLSLLRIHVVYYNIGHCGSQITTVCDPCHVPNHILEDMSVITFSEYTNISHPSRFTTAGTPVCSGSVKLSDARNFRGTWTALYPQGEYALTQFLAQGAANDATAAIAVPAGCKATVYTDGGFSTGGAPAYVGQTEPYCLRIVTGTAAVDAGTLNVNINRGNGHEQLVAGGTYASGALVYTGCYTQPLRSVQVTGPAGNDEWRGAVQYSSDGGLTYSGLVCTSSCGAGSDSASISVASGTGTAGTTTTCWGGTTCTLEPRNFCLHIVTGSGSSDDGYINVDVKRNGGYSAAVTPGQRWAKGSTVLTVCDAIAVTGVRVTASTNTDGWVGSIQYSTDGGTTYTSLTCTSCTAGSTSTDTTRISVDGNADSPANSTRCWNGALCVMEPRAMTVRRSHVKASAFEFLPGEYTMDQFAAAGSYVGCYSDYVAPDRDLRYGPGVAGGQGHTAATCSQICSGNLPWVQHANKYCAAVAGGAGYSSLALAQEGCAANANCGGVVDISCDGTGTFRLCQVRDSAWPSNINPLDTTCVYTRPESFRYFSLQYGGQCFCDNSYATSSRPSTHPITKLDDWMCDLPESMMTTATWAAGLLPGVRQGRSLTNAVFETSAYAALFHSVSAIQVGPYDTKYRLSQGGSDTTIQQVGYLNNTYRFELDASGFTNVSARDYNGAAGPFDNGPLDNGPGPYDFVRFVNESTAMVPDRMIPAEIVFHATAYGLSSCSSSNSSTHSASKNDCRAAAQSVFSQYYISQLNEVFNETLPYGCSVRDTYGSTKEAFFNTHLRGINDGTYQMICGMGKVTTTLTRSCLAGGWTMENAVCAQATCTPLAAVTNGHWTYEGGFGLYGTVGGCGTKATLVCDPCYEISGNATRECNGMSWSLAQPNCTLIVEKCPPTGLQPVTGNGTRVGTGYSCGDYRKHDCETCFAPSGANQFSECQSNGLWSVPDTTCAPVFCPPLTSSTGDSGIAIRNQSEWRYTHLPYNKTLYRLSYNGTVTDPAANIIPNETYGTGPLESVVPYVVSLPSYGYQDHGSCGTMAETTCKDCYEHRAGDLVRYCQTDGPLMGQYDGTNPLCVKRTTAALVDPPNGYWSYTHQVEYGGNVGPGGTNTYGYGQGMSATISCQTVANLICDACYEPTGQSQTTWNWNQGWSHPTNIRCRPKQNWCVTGEPASAPNNGWRNGTGTECGARRNYGCNTCFKYVGQETTTCLSNQRWSPIQAACRYIFCGVMPTLPANSGVLPWTLTGTQEEIECGQRITTSCQACHVATTAPSTFTRTCIATNIFDGTNPVCSPLTCAALPAVANGHWSVVHQSGNTLNQATCGSVASVTCDPCFQLYNTSRQHLTCEENGWNGDMPTCVPDTHVCDADTIDLSSPSRSGLIAVYNYANPSNGAMCGDTVTYSCPHRCFNLSVATNNAVWWHGQTTYTRTCQGNGTWSGTDNFNCTTTPKSYAYNYLVNQPAGHSLDMWDPLAGGSPFYSPYSDLTTPYAIRQSPYECEYNITLCPECQTNTDTLCRTQLATVDNTYDWYDNQEGGAPAQRPFPPALAPILKSCEAIGKNLCPMKCTRSYTTPLADVTVIALSGLDNNAATNLQRCVGECDADSQCAAGLKCFQRTNGESIPGCTGAGGGADWDYCYDPGLTPAYCPSCDLSEDGLSFCAATGRCKCRQSSWSTFNTINQTYGWHGDGCEYNELVSASQSFYKVNAGHLGYAWGRVTTRWRYVPTGTPTMSPTTAVPTASPTNASLPPPPTQAPTVPPTLPIVGQIPTAQPTASPSPAPVVPTPAIMYAAVECTSGHCDHEDTDWWWWVLVAIGGVLGCCCLGVMCYAEQFGEPSDPRLMDCFNHRDGHSCWYKLCYFVWYYLFFGCLFHKALHHGRAYNPRRTNPDGDCWYNAWFCVWYTFMCGCFCDTKPTEGEDEGEYPGVEMKSTYGEDEYTKRARYARSHAADAQL